MHSLSANSYGAVLINFDIVKLLTKHSVYGS